MKKSITIWTSALIVILAIVVPVINLSIATYRPLSAKKLIRVGHRGAAGLAPENTLSAIDSGLAHRVDYIEIDVRKTFDGQLIIMHDKTIDRTTNGSGAIHTLNFKQISNVSASSGFPGYNTITRVPQLRQVLSKVYQSKAKLLIEIKDPERYPAISDSIVSIIKETGSADKIAIFSFNMEIVKQIKQKLPTVETGIFCLGLECPNDSADYISPHWISILYYPQLINRLHKNGAQVLVWTPDNAFWMKYLHQMNVDGIITNRPDILTALDKN